MKQSELNQIINEEVRKILSEAKYDEKWYSYVNAAQEIAANSKLNYEDGWNALAAGLIEKFGFNEAKKLIKTWESKEASNNKHY